MANLTRRLFLRAAAVAAPLASIPAIAAAAKAPTVAPALEPTDADAEIFRLAKAFRSAKRAQKKAMRAVAQIEDRIEAGAPDYPPEPKMTREERSEHLAATIEMIRANRYGPLVTDYFDRHAAWRDARKTIQDEAAKAREASRELQAAERARIKASVAVSRIGSKLYRTRTRTIDGLLAKALIEREFEFDDAGFPRQLILDLRALKKAGAVIALPGRA